MMRQAAALLAVALGAGCAGNELALRAREVRGVLKAARDDGAYQCAPRPLAIAETHVEFAERALDRGDYFGARRHLEVSDAHAREASRLSPRERCVPAAPARPRRPSDVDGDGIADGEDRCPAEPEDRDGFEDDDGCPEPDNDHDGRLDAADRCPNEAEDLDGFEDDDGCPDPDNDRDGYADAQDRCPNEPGPPGADGCPPRYELVTVTREKIELSQTIFFQTNQAIIMARSFPLLDEVASVLKTRPSMKVRIEGHTDSRGSRLANLRLSQARADAVRAYLAGQGVPAERMEARGFGPDQPIETNRTAAGRERNRRVEFVILQQ